MGGMQSLFNILGEWGPLRFIAQSIRNKLLVTILALALLPLITLGVIAYNVGSNALTKQASGSLESIEHNKTQELLLWFKNRREDIATFSKSPYIRRQASRIVEGAKQLGNGDMALGVRKCRSLYLDKPQLDDAEDGSEYSATHAEISPYFKRYAKAYGYVDIHIISEDGYILYTTTKEDDYGANVVTSSYKNEAIGRIFERAMNELKSGNEDFAIFEDFTISKSGERPSSFMAAPTNGGQLLNDGSLLRNAIIVFEMPLETIDAIMSRHVGMGEKGESFLIGPDGLFRSDSRFHEQMGVQTTILNPKFKIDSPELKDALNGGDGIKFTKNYQGDEVLNSWGYLDVQAPTATHPEPIRWAIFAQLNKSEVLAPVYELAMFVGGVVLGALILVILSAFALSGALIRQVNAIMSLFSMIGMGEYDARAEVISQDELGEMAMSLNAMLDNTLTLIQSQEEKEAIQTSIMQLLDEVALVAEGDLSKNAAVKDDITGTIADSINFMLDQLRDIIATVQGATLQVSSSANEIQTTAEHLAEGSENQAGQIADTSAAIDEMAVSIQQVSENAALSATVGEQAMANARQGTEAVQNTISGMNRIRGQVQETAKRIKRLGESSQEIGEIVQLIGDIADRTSILALNASIQAAMAGEAGRGFAVVAEEVERLADRSTNATKQIDGLIKTIQSEMNEAVAAMESTTHEVVDGSKLADQAGRALSEIESVSSRLSELIQSISLASKQQARGSEALANSMTEIAEVTQQTAAGTKQAAVSINNLANLADELRASVSRFKLSDAS